jgi:hypothetical protein
LYDKVLSDYFRCHYWNTKLEINEKHRK